jgi:beta-glucosidase
MANAGKPIVLVILEGRPRLISSVVSSAAAVVHGLLPGPMGGLAIAQVLSGVLVPSGRLPFTYPRYSGDIPYTYHHKTNDKCTNSSNVYDYIICEVSSISLHQLM